MVKHLVFWKLQDFADGKPAAQNALRIKEALEALRGRIPGLVTIEVGIDFSKTADSADVALYTEFTDRAALDAYQDHPDHKSAAKFIGAVRQSRTVVDYEV